MKILSHRGFWKKTEEKNTEAAFRNSFEMGFGTETDIRDYNGKLVISHDVADDTSMTLEHFIDIYHECRKNIDLPLALNIKSDGLQNMLIEVLDNKKVENYFVFDMSIPDAILYFNKNISTFFRYSEYEPLTELYKISDGVWVDGFKEDTVTEELLFNVINDNKKVCIVSSELHKRDYMVLWSKLNTYSDDIINSDSLMICTDFPEDAKVFFNGK